MDFADLLGESVLKILNKSACSLRFAWFFRVKILATVFFLHYIAPAFDSVKCCGIELSSVGLNLTKLRLQS
jgi:hypothetical protein